MPRRLPVLATLVVAVLAASASPAAAEVRRLDYTVGPIEVAPYQVRQNGVTIDIPKPDVDGSITSMEVDLVDADGEVVPIERLMLHHIVFTNLGTTLGEKKDPTCDTFTALDSVSKIPALAERFYAAGEERAKLQLPGGYGYRVGGGDRWGLTWMVMNHRARTDRAYIRYRIGYDTDPSLTPVKPVWLDAANCRMDPIYDVPGGGRPGSTHTRTSDWTAPEGGRVVAAGGHVHGGGLDLRLSQPDCGDRTLARITPTWGDRDHPFYTVKPVLHEPGPVHMRGFTSAAGLPVGAGRRLRLSSRYDGERPHTRVMGILIAFLAPLRPEDAGVPCPALPGDVVGDAAPPGRKAPPEVTVPLTGLDARGKAVTIRKPPGRTVRKGRRATVRVRGFAFSRPNLSVRRGATVEWAFEDPELHDVTLASGPRGFSSPHQGEGGLFRKTLTKPGTYRLFCSLHPVAMTERIVVRRK